MKKVIGLLAAIAVVVGCASRNIRPTVDKKVELTPEKIERGRYLAENVAACGACHDGRASGNFLDPASPELKMAGGSVLEDGEIAAYIPNITSDAETGVGNWTDDELIRGIRDGVRPDGSIMFPLMPYGVYAKMSDADVEAVVAYLRSLPKVKQTRPRTELKAPGVFKMAIGMGVTLHEPAVNVPHPDESNKVTYGRYLADMAHCTVCHSLGGTGPREEKDKFMAGADSPMDLPGVGKVWAANLTPDKATGIGRYSAEQIKLSLTTGMRLDGKPMAPPMSTMIPYWALMTEADKDALAAWLQSLPPVQKQIPARQLTAEYAKLLGE